MKKFTVHFVEEAEAFAKSCQDCDLIKYKNFMDFAKAENHRRKTLKFVVLDNQNLRNLVAFVTEK